MRVKKYTTTKIYYTNYGEKQILENGADAVTGHSNCLEMRLK